MRPKFILIQSLVMLQVTALYAQKPNAAMQAPSMPIDSVTRLISYTGVVQAPGLKASLLYERALSWANAYYKNPVDVIREKDPAKGKIVIKARYKIYNEPDKKGTITDAGDVMYTLTIQFKDGRYRYEITKFSWQQLSVFAAERWADTASPTYSPAYPYYLKQTDDQAHEVASALKKRMAQSEVKPAKDW